MSSRRLRNVALRFSLVMLATFAQIHADDTNDGAQGSRIVFSSPEFVFGEF